MGQNSRPVCKLCRRAGQKLFLKGQRCASSKCSFERRDYPPGPRGRARGRRRRRSDYGRQLREKQKMRQVYGVQERQFRRYVREAERMAGISGDNLLQLLERRLDNAVYRMGLATSRAQARQLVSHRHIALNGRTVNVPSALVEVGDEVVAREKSKDLPGIQEAVAATAAGGSLSWLEVDKDARRVKIIGLPRREEIDCEVDEQQVMEFYSR